MISNALKIEQQQHAICGKGRLFIDKTCLLNFLPASPHISLSQLSTVCYLKRGPGNELFLKWDCETRQARL